jgi:enoyl-CoA hydratase
VSNDVVRTDLVDGALWITIDRPEQRNALNADVNRGLLAALARLREDDEAKLAVLTGAGDKAFCAGADLGGLNPEAGAVALHRGRSMFADVLRELRSVPKPVVGRVNGHALAGGFGLALGCDLLIAAEDATFGTTEVKVGMWPYMITAVIVEHLGPKRTLELMMTGKRIDAAQALEWGLVNQVVPAAQLDEAVGELVAQLAGLSPVVLSLGKESYAAAMGMPRDEALSYLGSMLALHLQTEDVVEGVTAFLQKRPPEWKAR